MLHRGDQVAGSVVLVHRDRSDMVQVLTRVLAQDGRYIWRTTKISDSIDDWIARNRRFDPDLWIVELDTPNLARFIDETIS